MALTEEQWKECGQKLPSAKDWYTARGHTLRRVSVPGQSKHCAVFKARASVSFSPLVTGRLYWWERVGSE